MGAFVRAAEVELPSWAGGGCAEEGAARCGGNRVRRELETGEQQGADGCRGMFEMREPLGGERL